MPTTETTTAPEMTNEQATDEAVLLLTRKLMRLHPEAYTDVISKLPEGSRQAILLAEVRADRHRDSVGGPSGIVYPADPFELDEE